MISKSARFAALLAVFGAGCTDQIPTLSDPTLFPGSLPTTIQYSVGDPGLVLSGRSVRGPTTVKDVFFKLLANDFDGSLDANLVAQFNGFPKAVVVGTVTDSSYTYVESAVVASLPDTLRTTADLLEFQLWTITQPFDSLNVTWSNAKDRSGDGVPWTTPGGTRGRLLSTAVWVKSSTGANADSLRWVLPADVITALADSTLPGLLVTMATPGARAEISSLVIEAKVRPEVQDTIITQTVTSAAQTFVYTPEPEIPASVFRVGGFTSDRTVLNLSIDQTLPGCPDPENVPCSERLPLEDVTLNRVQLVFDPVPVTRGFRPIAPIRLTFRRLLEPELGDRATLGEIVVEDTISTARFTPGGTEPVAFEVTAAVATALARGEDELYLAILIEPEGTTPSYAWLRNPRLRFVYTLPQRPQLP